MREERIFRGKRQTHTHILRLLSMYKMFRSGSTRSIESNSRTHCNHTPQSMTTAAFDRIWAHICVISRLKPFNFASQHAYTHAGTHVDNSALGLQAKCICGTVPMYACVDGAGWTASHSHTHTLDFSADVNGVWGRVGLHQPKLALYALSPSLTHSLAHTLQHTHTHTSVFTESYRHGRVQATRAHISA